MSDYPSTAAQLARQRDAERQLRHDAYSYRGEREQSQQTLRQAQELLRELAARDTLRAQTGATVLDQVRTQVQVAEEPFRMDVTHWYVNGIRQDLPRQPPRAAPEPVEERPVTVMVGGEVQERRPRLDEPFAAQRQVAQEKAARWANYDRYYSASRTDTATRAECEQHKEMWMKRFAWRKEHGKETAWIDDGRRYEPQTAAD